MESSELTREDFNTGMQEMVDNIQDVMKAINSMNQVVEKSRLAINTHAEIAGLHRYLLERFIPAPTLMAAVKEYSELRAQAIEQERLAGLGVPASHSGN
jgi:hypothetical protein